MQNFTYSLLLLFILISCSTSSKKAEPILEEKPTIEASIYSEIVLWDRFDNALVLDTVNYVEEAEFPPVYIGPKADSIELIYKPSKIAYRDFVFEKYTPIDSGDFKLFIDTTRAIGRSMDIQGSYQKAEYRKNKKSYPIFIENIAADTLFIGADRTLGFIVEAQDSTGVWRPTQEIRSIRCGTGILGHYLPPSYIAISSMKIYHGDFKTKLRLVFQSDEKIYSNEITGYINYSQFGKAKR